MPSENSLIHQALIALEIALGYPAGNLGGLCHGITMKWLEASLLGPTHVARLEKRIDLISKTPTHELIEKINAIQDKLITKSVASYDDLPDDEKLLLEIRALYDGIQIYQTPLAHEPIFEKKIPQHDIETTSVLASNAMIQEQGYIAKVYSESGIYTAKQFTEQLRKLELIFDKNQKDGSFHITGPQHAMGLHYNWANKEWTFMDINVWPPVKSSNIEQIVSDLYKKSLDYYYKSEHKENPAITLNIQQIIPISKKNETLNNELSELKQSNIKSINLKQAETLDVRGVRLLRFAAQTNQPEMVQHLLTLGVKADPKSDDEISAMEFAIQNGASKIVETLLENGANPNRISNQAQTPLAQAILSNQLDIVNQLLDKNADVNQSVSTKTKEKPLDIAAKYGHLAIIKALIEKNAKFSHETSFDFIFNSIQKRDKSNNVLANLMLLYDYLQNLKQNDQFVRDDTLIQIDKLINNLSKFTQDFFSKTTESKNSSSTIADEFKQNLVMLYEKMPLHSPTVPSHIIQIIQLANQLNLINQLPKLPNDQNQPIMKLLKEVSALSSYCETLSTTSPKEAKDSEKMINKLFTLINQYQENLLLTQAGLVSSSNPKKQQIQKEFNNALDNCYQSMGKHRKIWKPILANISIAATGIGLPFFIGKISTTGQGFFSKTKRQQLVEGIKDAFEQVKKQP